MIESEASASAAEAVIPTESPLDADSEIALPELSVSPTAEVVDSLVSSLRLIVKVSLDVEPSEDSATTVMLCSLLDS